MSSYPSRDNLEIELYRFDAVTYKLSVSKYTKIVQVRLCVAGRKALPSKSVIYTETCSRGRRVHRTVKTNMCDSFIRHVVHITPVFIFFIINNLICLFLLFSSSCLKLSGYGRRYFISVSSCCRKTMKKMSSTLVEYSRSPGRAAGRADRRACRRRISPSRTSTDERTCYQDSHCACTATTAR